jgi:HK97 gp10 family phage protein
VANQSFKVGVTGAKELLALVTQMQSDFGEKDTRKVLAKAARKSMLPALNMAKRLAHDGRDYSTGELAASLQIEVRKPTRRDKRSKYVSNTDAVIATITTAPKSKLVKIRKKVLKARARRGGKAFDAQQYDAGIPKFDARAIAQEFGTAKISARPFLRPAIEANAQAIVSALGKDIMQGIKEHYANNSVIK